jgi:hypothetical protein
MPRHVSPAALLLRQKLRCRPGLSDGPAGETRHGQIAGAQANPGVTIALLGVQFCR